MTMTARAALICAGLLVADPLAAQDPAEPAADAPSEMTQYQLVFLTESEDWEPPVDEHPHRAERIEKGRKFHLAQLLRGGGALVAGDILDGEALKAVAILDIDASEARTAFERSPAVESGRLVVEVFSWWAARGILAPLEPTEDPEDLVAVWLGLFERPSRAPHFPEEELARLQEGHLKNLERMHEQGDLVIAGPVEDGGELRGILIFRTPDRQRIERLVQEDPMVQAGRLVLELYRWQVPRGSVPDA
jgi:uncharacterized protein YciI